MADQPFMCWCVVCGAETDTELSMPMLMDAFATSIGNLTCGACGADVQWLNVGPAPSDRRIVDAAYDRHVEGLLRSPCLHNTYLTAGCMEASHG